jgi:hypothetical protein
MEKIPPLELQKMILPFIGFDDGAPSNIQRTVIVSISESFGTSVLGTSVKGVESQTFCLGLGAAAGAAAKKEDWSNPPAESKPPGAPNAFASNAA